MSGVRFVRVRLDFIVEMGTKVTDDEAVSVLEDLYWRGALLEGLRGQSDRFELAHVRGVRHDVEVCDAPCVVCGFELKGIGLPMGDGRVHKRCRPVPAGGQQ